MAGSSTVRARLIHLNGPPGIGKSTLARRYVAEHPGTLNCDVDVLRSLVGGWQQDFDTAGALIRPAAIAMIGAYLASGHDVVFPQMLVDPGELARFEAAATEAGADVVEVMLMDSASASLQRFHRRGGEDPWHDQVREIVAGLGGDDLLLRSHQGLQVLAAQRPTVTVLTSVEGDEDATYRALLAALAPAGPRHDGAMTATTSGLDWPLRTERLTIRPATPDDVDATWRFRRLPEVGEWITRAPQTRAEYAEQFLDEDRLAKTLVVELEGEVIGDLMLSIEDAWAQAEVADRARGVQAELGWVLDPAHAGHGYATEAVEGLIRFCFERLGLRRVTANCFADNVASRRLMERVGMRLELHTRQESLHRSGRWLDGLGYALLADEWRARRQA
ncbi:MAG TPA: GNAT family N-acetyltransferase [Marmoricola sp.]|nr:GNAT family N-acetyltransferase [Marmoricola sp.]